MYIGPSIQKCCFEVSEDILDNFYIECVTPAEKTGKYKVSLQKQAFEQMAYLGFAKNHIKVSNSCTFCLKEKYHSYRRDGKHSGRMIGIIGVS